MRWNRLMHLFGVNKSAGNKKAFEAEEQDSLWGPPETKKKMEKKVSQQHLIPGLLAKIVLHPC